MFRSFSVIGLAAALVLSACSSSGDSTSSTSTSSTAVTSIAPSTVPAATVAPTTTTVPAEPQIVTVDVSAPDLGIGATVSGDAELVGDPFGEPFATCSAYRTVAGAYAVGVGDPDGELVWVSVVSATRIDAAGAVPADVRIELSDGREIDGSGAVVLDNDLAGGTFVATATDGSAIEGSFECAGSDRPPVTMAATEDGAIELVALVEADDHERVFTAAVLGVDAADCPIGDDLIVRIDGDTTTGSISAFELVGPADAATLDVRVGGTMYEFDGVVVDADEATRSGTFAAVGDVTVAGAFSCS